MFSNEPHPPTPSRSLLPPQASCTHPTSFAHTSSRHRVAHMISSRWLCLCVSTTARRDCKLPILTYAARRGFLRRVVASNMRSRSMIPVALICAPPERL
jgi:hypothetical protein